MRDGTPTTATVSVTPRARLRSPVLAAAANRGFNRRSSGGYPVAASSGNIARSAPLSEAWSSNVAIRARFPSRSPTGRLHWHRATRRWGWGMLERGVLGTMVSR